MSPQIKETYDLRCQKGTTNFLSSYRRYNPYAYTEEGIITIEKIKYGKYYILEKEAPEGYELNTEKMWFEIREDGEIIKSVMKDHKIIRVPITDATDYKELIFSGVTLIIAGVGLIVLSKKKKQR